MRSLCRRIKSSKNCTSPARTRSMTCSSVQDCCCRGVRGNDIVPGERVTAAQKVPEPSGPQERLDELLSFLFRALAQARPQGGESGTGPRHLRDLPDVPVLPPQLILLERGTWLVGRRFAALL